jgi:integrase
MFLAHLCEAGGERPHPARSVCAWCALRGFPDGRPGPGWSASTRKGYLAAIRFLYRHCHMEEDLPSVDPSAYLAAPRVVVRRGYTPTREEVGRLLSAPGRPTPRLLAHWIFFAPSRLQTFADALWEHIDLQDATWYVVGKGGKADVFDLHPLLVRELRHYERWQQEVADRNPALRLALASPDTAFVLLTRTGSPMRASTIAKVLKWHAVRAGVGVVKTDARNDAPRGLTSRVSPHALRRAWATAALNDPDNPQPLDVVQEVLTGQ